MKSLRFSVEFCELDTCCCDATFLNEGIDITDNRPLSIQAVREGALLALLITIGSVNLIYPFSGDQALFTIGAQAISKGAVLYRDFWDLKQPGIYWFYLAAGRTFGFTEIGVHLFELIYFVLFAAILSISTRRYFAESSTALFAAGLAVGVYLVVCGPWHLTQAEGLVAFPLFLSLLFLCPLQTNDTVGLKRYFAFGISAAAVVLFKLILVLLPMAFLIVAVVPQLLKRRQTLGAVMQRSILPAVAGAALVLVPAIIYFGAHHQIGLLYKTFSVPPRIVSELPMNSVKVLLRSGKWFVRAVLPLLPFAMIGAVNRIRRGDDAFTVGLICWIVAGSGLILGQRMWWEYHFLLLIVPMGLLAAAGFETVNISAKQRWPRSKWLQRAIGALSLILLLAPFAWRWGEKISSQCEAGILISFEAQQQFRERLSPGYALAAQEARESGITGPTPGGIYVIGDPLIYFLAHQQQAVALNGWSPEWFLHEQWDELASELAIKRPAYIFITADYRILALLRGKPVISILDQQYNQTRTSGEGAWYTLKATSPFLNKNGEILRGRKGWESIQ